MLGTALQAGAPPDIAYIFAGRWFAGMAIGSLSMLVPMFNAELAPPGIRGSLVALQQLAITFGVSLIGGCYKCSLSDPRLVLDRVRHEREFQRR